jgi:hypothetical protein
VMLPLPLMAKRLRCLSCIFMTAGESSYTRPPFMIVAAWKDGCAQCMHASAAAATQESTRLGQGEHGRGGGKVRTGEAEGRAARKRGTNLKRRPWQEKYMRRVSQFGMETRQSWARSL